MAKASAPIAVNHQTGALEYAGSPGSVIGYVAYVPVGDTTYSSTTSTYADVDATNVKVTFTVPTSGAVLVRANFIAGPANTIGLGVNLRSGSSDVALTGQRSAYNSAGSQQMRMHHEWILTGLTPGASLTYKLGFNRHSGTASAATINVGDTTWGGIYMTVLAL